MEGIFSQSHCVAQFNTAHELPSSGPAKTAIAARSCLAERVDSIPSVAFTLTASPQGWLFRPKHVLHGSGWPDPFRPHRRGLHQYKRPAPVELFSWMLSCLFVLVDLTSTPPSDYFSFEFLLPDFKNDAHFSTVLAMTSTASKLVE